MTDAAKGIFLMNVVDAVFSHAKRNWGCVEDAGEKLLRGYFQEFADDPGQIEHWAAEIKQERSV